MTNPLIGILDELRKERHDQQKEFLAEQAEREKKEAESIINGLRNIIFEAYRNRRKTVDVMSFGGVNLDPTMLCGAARIVYDACIEAGLSVKFRASTESFPCGRDDDIVQMFIELQQP